ncbi:MAG: hypothetical protein DMG75_08410 [Acidobacteria bacterium]|nr:MAG: hypothetical protein DMG75_08410 [Acidobacteriota bacterium]
MLGGFDSYFSHLALPICGAVVCLLGKANRKVAFDRGLRIFGAVLLSAVVIYFVGFGLGLYGSN